MFSFFVEGFGSISDRYLGAGKHPSPLDKTKTQSPNQELTVGFYRIKKYCSYQKLRPFKDRARTCDVLPAPIDVSIDTNFC